MQVNKVNFLRWDNELPSTDQPDIPYAYWQDRGHCGYMPIGYPTEAISFYINTVAGLNYPNFSDLRLDLANVGAGITANFNVAPLQQHFIDNTNTKYNIYATVVMPQVPDGIYRFVIYRQSDGFKLMTSSYIWVRNNKAELDEQTVYCRFRHDRHFFGIKYHELTGFYQQFRLNISLLEEQVEVDKETYTEQSTGLRRTSHGDLAKWRKVETYYFDPPAHDAAAAMFEHRYLELNGAQYTVKSSYKRDPPSRSKLTKGEAELWDNSFSALLHCQ